MKSHTHTHRDEVKALSRPSLHLFTNIRLFLQRVPQQAGAASTGECRARKGRQPQSSISMPLPSSAQVIYFASRSEKIKQRERKQQSGAILVRFEAKRRRQPPPPIIVSTCSSDANALWHIEMCSLLKKQKQNRQQNRQRQQTKISASEAKSQISFI